MAQTHGASDGGSSFDRVLSTAMGYGDGPRGGGYGGMNGYRGKDGKGGSMNGTMPSKGKGEPRRSPAKFVPARGGGEWGKRMRQAQQAAIKDEKTKREVDYFWQQQEYFSGGVRWHRAGQVSRKADRIAGLETFDELWERERCKRLRG
eukprot:Skav209456  [mRNA]  locus=scaffold4004:76723:87308:- [translate_table: standard]